MARAPFPTARLVEALVAAAAGAALGGAVALAAGLPAAVAAAASAGLNGAFGGFRRIYDWRSPAGWLAFTADSTWGLAGTTLGNLLNLANSLRARSGFRTDLSRRQNRQLFDRGASLRRGFALTLGNVVSNASIGSSATEPRPLVVRHEDLHVWQSRAFGPLFQVVYVVWFALGLAVGLATWAARRGEPGLFRLVEAAAYYDNPFEYWAYARTGHWADNRADPVLKWHRPRPSESKGGSPGEPSGLSR